MQRGAQNVSVEFFRTEKLDDTTHRSEYVHVQRRTSYDPYLQQKTSFLQNAWLNTGRMFGLRARAFKTAMHHQKTAQKKYDFFLYLREDNLFFQPLNLDKLANLVHRKSVDQAALAVDKYCGWGAYSNKIYFVNPMAATTLFRFDPHFFKAYRESIDSRGGIGTTDAQGRARSTDSRQDAMQTEAFVANLLQADNVEILTWDFHRTEVRYIGGKMCVAAIYWYCTADLAGADSSEMCETKRRTWYAHRRGGSMATRMAWWPLTPSRSKGRPGNKWSQPTSSGIGNKVG
jgi:hypothetical protein